MSFAVILNPASGGVEGTAELEERICAGLPGAHLFLAAHPGDASGLAASALAAGFQTIVAAGGDGTLNEVLNGVAGELSRVRLGLLPLGTGNDFARVAGLSTELEENLSLLKIGRTCRLDVVRVTSTSNQRLMINVSAGGFSGTVDEKLTDELKSSWGPLCYLRGLIEALPELSAYACEVTLDDEERLIIAASNIAVANGRFVAKGVPIAPEALIDDGRVDLVAITADSVGELALLGPQILLGTHLDDEQIIFRRARKIEIHSTPPMSFNTDGELLGECPCVFEVLPGAVEFVVGENAATAFER